MVVGTAGPGQGTVAVAGCRVGGWCGAVGGREGCRGLWGSTGLRAARPRWGRTAAGARWTGRSWHL